MTIVEEDFAAPPAEMDDDDPLGDFWGACHLTRILTDPPRYDLKLADGRVLRLRTAQFFNIGAFTQAFIDATGDFPPLPVKGAAKYLLEVFRRLLADRRDVPMVEEASTFGTIVADIKLAILACPQTDEPRDIERGALFQSPEGGTWVNARCLLARVQQACPVGVRPGDFYDALVRLGLVHLGPKRAGGWQGRVWSVPAELVTTLPKANGLNGAAAHLQLPLATTENGTT